MAHGWMQPKGPLNENDKRRLVLKLVTQLRCAGCNRSFKARDFELLDRRDDVWLLGVACPHCDVSAHVVVLMHLEAEPDLLMDLTPEERKEAATWPAITGDDVLDLHAFLREFDGDFESLLSD